MLKTVCLPDLRVALVSLAWHYFNLPLVIHREVSVKAYCRVHVQKNVCVYGLFKSITICKWVPELIYANAEMGFTNEQLFVVRTFKALANAELDVDRLISRNTVRVLRVFREFSIVGWPSFSDLVHTEWWQALAHAILCCNIGDICTTQACYCTNSGCKLVRYV